MALIKFTYLFLQKRNEEFMTSLVARVSRLPTEQLPPEDHVANSITRLKTSRISDSTDSSSEIRSTSSRISSEEQILSSNSLIVSRFFEIVFVLSSQKLRYFLLSHSTAYILYLLQLLLTLHLFIRVTLIYLVRSKHVK